MTLLRFYGRHIAAIAGLIVLALIVSLYIATKDRLRFPWDHPRQYYAEFSSAQSVTPGQGQTVNVAGVAVGQISGVQLVNGRARVGFTIESKDIGPIYRNAHMLLRPKTGLNDMTIEMDPGSPDPSQRDGGKLEDGETLPAWNTRPNVNSDEVLAALDADTRNYLAIVAGAGGQGTRGRGVDRRRIIRAGAPTLASTKRVAAALSDRRQKVARLVSNLRTLAHATASRDTQLASLVGATEQVFSTVSAHDADLGRAVDRLPAALGALDRALPEARALADDLRPSLAALRPTVRQLTPALVQVRPLLRTATPVVRDDLRPLVREATPLVRRLRPSVDLVNRADPDLIPVVRILNYTVNELAYNPPGPEEGYLFWLPWFAHNSASIFSVEDAHGATWRGLAMVGCSSASQLFSLDPTLAPIGNSLVCPSPAQPRRGAKGGAARKGAGRSDGRGGSGGAGGSGGGAGAVPGGGGGTSLPGVPGVPGTPGGTPKLPSPLGGKHGGSGLPSGLDGLPGLRLGGRG